MIAKITFIELYITYLFPDIPQNPHGNGALLEFGMKYQREELLLFLMHCRADLSFQYWPQTDSLICFVVAVKSRISRFVWSYIAYILPASDQCLGMLCVFFIFFVLLSDGGDRTAWGKEWFSHNYAWLQRTDYDPRVSICVFVLCLIFLRMASFYPYRIEIFLSDKLAISSSL